MVFPTRIADPHFRAGSEFAQEIGADLQCTGAANRLHRDGTTRLDDVAVRAEQQQLDRLVVRWQTIDWQVTARGRFVSDLALDAFHAFEQRYLARVVAVN